MSIASRINEMTEHLRNDWNSIDKLGLDITEENSNDNLDKNIKNIAPVLDRFYNQTSDKTDLAKNGVVGRTSQDGDPTPENPVEINNLSGDVEYKVRGKNLFDLTNITMSSDTATLENGEINLTWTQDFNLDLSNIVSNLVNGTSYTISFKHKGNALYLRNKQVDRNTNILQTNNDDDYITYSITLNNITAFEFRFVRKDNTGTAYIKDIQIEKGVQATTYEPYISETFPLSLGDIELCNISDYKDRIYSQNGKFYLEKKNGKVVLNGSESVSRATTRISEIYRFAITGPTDMKKTADDLPKPAGLVISNRFIEVSNTVSYNTADSINGILVRVNNTNTFIINCIETQTYTVEQFKEWLSTHNTKIQYVLATPTNTEIAQENYPTLYSQLLAIQEFLTKYKINKEFLLDYSSPEIEY